VRVQAVADFRERIAHYESVYESVSEKVRLDP